MPPVISGNTNQPSAFSSSSANFTYKYTDGLDLKPGSPFHEKLRKRLMEYAQAGHDAMSGRHTKWQAIDKKMDLYIPASAAEDMIKNKDSRKPISLVIPTSYAIRDTLITYLVAAFLQDTIFKYYGVGPEDKLGAILLEHVIKNQSAHAGHALALNTMWTDGVTYGLGIVAPIWYQEYQFRKVKPGVFDSLFGAGEDVEEYMAFEGNRLENIDPYLYLPDPNVAALDYQRGEFVGWLRQESMIELLDMDSQKGDSMFFNVKYLKAINGERVSTLMPNIGVGGNQYGRSRSEFASQQGKANNNRCDVIYLYVTLIPKDWNLGDSERSEKWIFAIGADKVIIAAQPLGLYHNRYPIAVCAPDSNGYSVSPISRLELVYGMQEFGDWLVNTHITNIRRCINNIFVIDPSLLNIPDFKQDDQGGLLVRLRQPAWGRSGAVREAIQQLNVMDVTKTHIADLSLVTQLMREISGATDQLHGIRRQGGERVTATESQGDRASALSKLEKMAKLIAFSAHKDIAFLLMNQTQQLMSQETWVKVADPYMETLIQDYQMYDPQLMVSPDMISGSYDVIPSDGMIPSSANYQVWSDILQSLTQSPMLMQMSRLDIGRIYRHMCRIGGATDIDQFQIAAPQTPQGTTQSMSTDQIGAQEQAGNIVPMNQLEGMIGK